MMKYLLSLSMLVSCGVFASEGSQEPQVPTSSKSSRSNSTKDTFSYLADLPGKLGIKYFLMEAAIDCLNKRGGSTLVRGVYGVNTLQKSDLVHVADAVAFAAKDQTTDAKKLAVVAVKVFAREKALQGGTVAFDALLKKANLSTTRDVKERSVKGRFTITAAEYAARYGIDRGIQAFVDFLKRK